MSQEQQECKCTLDQSKFVHIDGDETINNIKTFSGRIKIPNNTTDDTESVVNLKYIQENYVDLKKDNTIEGKNTFTGSVTFDENVFFNKNTTFGTKDDDQTKTIFKHKAYDKSENEIVGIANSAAAHNSLYRGKDLTVYTDEEEPTIIWDKTIEQISEKISDNDWTDLFIGDYIVNSLTINGETTEHIWRFAGFDWLLGYGDDPIEDHHIVIVPDKCLLSAPMNKTATTDTGLCNSTMWNDTLNSVSQAIISLFTEDHVLQYRTLISTAIDSSLGTQSYPDWMGPASEFKWEYCYANLMSEQQLYGSSIMNSSMYDIGDAYGQFPLFRYDRNCIIKERNWFWLRNIAKMNLFALTNYDTFAETLDATSSLGVRPFFLFV